MPQQPKPPAGFTEEIPPPPSGFTEAVGGSSSPMKDAQNALSILLGRKSQSAGKKPALPQGLRGGLSAFDEVQNFVQHLGKRALEIPEAIEGMAVPLLTLGAAGDISNLNPLNTFKAVAEDPAAAGMSLVNLDQETQRTGSRGQVAADTTFGRLKASWQHGRLLSRTMRFVVNCSA